MSDDKKPRTWELIQGEKTISLFTLADGPSVEIGKRIKVIEYDAYEAAIRERDELKRQLQIPKAKHKPDEKVKSVMFRLPVDLFEPFNKALEESNLSAQKLLESMVHHCLIESAKEKK